MSADVVEHRALARPSLHITGLLPLALREGARMLTSPAIALTAVYVLFVGGVGTITGEEISRAMAAEFAEVIAMFFAIVVFPAAHLTATSARRAGAEAQLSAAPTDPLRRDLALCLGVVLGPGLVGLVIALLGRWAAGGGVVDVVNDVSVDPWTSTDVLQVVAMVIGAGILGIVVARWLPFPGSLLIGFVGMVFLTVWAAGLKTYGWFAWFQVSSSDVKWSLAAPTAHLAWHTAYLFAWSAVGVCAIGIRQAPRKRFWLVAFFVSLGLVAVTGMLQLPPFPVELFG